MYKFLILLWALPALGSTILYSNFAPTQPPYSSLGEDIDSQRKFTSGFQVNTSGALTAIKLPLYARTSPSLSGPLNIDLIEQIFGGFHTLESWTTPSSSVNPFSITLINLQSVLNPFLSTGTKYFLQLSVPNTETGTFVWARNNQLDKQGQASINGSTGSGLTSGAFEVTGTSGVPEPSTWLMLSSSIFALLLLRRR